MDDARSGEQRLDHGAQHCRGLIQIHLIWRDAPLLVNSQNGSQNRCGPTILTQAVGKLARDDPLPDPTSHGRVHLPVARPHRRTVSDGLAPFDFAGITLRTPDVIFEGQTVLDVGGREVRVRDLGPAHTAADCVIHIPDDGVLFAGDLLFIGPAPLVWSGAISNWITACDNMIATGVNTFVPGHGPVTDTDGVRKVRDYLAFVIEAAEDAHRQGKSFTEAADGLDLGEYARWLDSERIVANIYRHYTFIEPDSRTRRDRAIRTAGAMAQQVPPTSRMSRRSALNRVRQPRWMSPNRHAHRRFRSC